MHARLRKGSLLLRFGRQFNVQEVERLSETVQSFAPLSQLTLDFTEVRECQGLACDLLAKTLAANPTLKVVFRGLDLHLSRMLGCFGVGEPGLAVST
jgi:hypothetical protein